VHVFIDLEENSKEWLLIEGVMDSCLSVTEPDIVVGEVLYIMEGREPRILKNSVVLGHINVLELAHIGVKMEEVILDVVLDWTTLKLLDVKELC
jgi:hypothetical protein